MTAPMKTAVAADEPFRCPAWCTPALCIVTPGETALHRHTMGAVAGNEVTVERLDVYDPATARVRVGRPQVHGHGDAGMTVDQVDDLVMLLKLAAIFVGEVS